MDLQEWEVLSVDGLLDFHGDGEVKLYSPNRNSQSKGVLDAYFRCPSPDSMKLLDPQTNPRVHDQIVSPVQLDSGTGISLDLDGAKVKEITKFPIDEPVITPKVKALDFGGDDQDPVSQVSFKKTKESNKFVDMKKESPVRCGSGVRGIVPPIEAFCFQDRDEVNCNKMERPFSPRMKREKSDRSGNSWEDGKGGLKMWRWGLCGIGALCSFGVVAAAATCCILILGSRHGRDKQNSGKHSLRFQIYADDKRIKQVVHHASKLNEAISAVRGVPLTGAHITFGGYYDGL